MIRNLFTHARRRAIAASALAALLAPSVAQADLMLFPTRIVVAANQRSAQVEIVNKGTTPETYRIAILNRRMNETGEISDARTTEPGEQFADTMLVYTPRQVTLEPGMSQTVRVTVRRPAGLADGEYRSHLQFDRVADATAATNLETAAQPEKGQVAIVLQALVGASIPVIVRQGQTSASVTLDSLALVPAKADTPPAVTFQFHRQGNQSVYGDIAVSYVTPSGKSHDLAQMNGIAVYVPNATRTMRVALTLPEGVALKGGTLKVRYNERPDAGGKLLAENTVSVP